MSNPTTAVVRHQPVLSDVERLTLLGFLARSTRLPIPAPRTLRHAFITAALDAGVPLRDVQEAASQADPRTAMRYDWAASS